MKVMEIEKAYEVRELSKIEELAINKGYELVQESEETDTYFTDKEEMFIENKTCLRIRRKDSSYMELTYKPKSTAFTEKYGKKEVNIKIDINDYEDIKYILLGLGYEEYIEFTKERKVYSKKDGVVEYNIMLDNLKEIGNFVEFEVISDENVLNDKRVSALEGLLNEFNMSNAKEKNIPYRDIAKEHFNNMNQ